MKKIRLDLEALAVESFATGGDESGSGTVRAYNEEDGITRYEVWSCKPLEELTTPTFETYACGPTGLRVECRSIITCTK